MINPALSNNWLRMLIMGDFFAAKKGPYRSSVFEPAYQGRRIPRSYALKFIRRTKGGPNDVWSFNDLHLSCKESMSSDRLNKHQVQAVFAELAAINY